MEWNQTYGRWDQYKGKAKQCWAKITENDWLAIKGDKEVLTRKMRQSYGYEKVKAEMELQTFLSACHKVGAFENKKNKIEMFPLYDCL